jgi:hypothetical protein
MKIIKVSSKKYEARDQDDALVFTIKRKGPQKYIVRLGHDSNDMVVFDNLQDAKAHIRCSITEPTTCLTDERSSSRETTDIVSDKKEGWITYFTTNMKGMSFTTREACNQYMRVLADQWHSL